MPMWYTLESMRQYLLGIVTFLTILGMVPTTLAARARPELQGQVVIVDAGHGGRDFGARVTGVDEKDLVLSISRKTAAALRGAGAKVVETRRSDSNLISHRPEPSNLQRMNLQARVDLATRNEADIFLSIHANKYSDSSVHGAQIFIGENPDAERLLLGTCLQAEMSAVTGGRRQLDMLRDLYLMRHLTIPAALIEVGFLSNPAERNRMLDSAYQDHVAQAITRGVMCFVRGRSALNLPPHQAPGPIALPDAPPT